MLQERFSNITVMLQNKKISFFYIKVKILVVAKMLYIEETRKERSNAPKSFVSRLIPFG